MAYLGLHLHHARHSAPPRKLPVGIGLAIGAALSCGLWAGIAFAVGALL